MSTNDSSTSAPRASIYGFGAAIIAIVAYYVDAELQEVALWQAGLAAAIPFGGLVMATVRTWPKRVKDTDADG